MSALTMVEPDTGSPVFLESHVLVTLLQVARETLENADEATLEAYDLNEHDRALLVRQAEQLSEAVK